MSEPKCITKNFQFSKCLLTYLSVAALVLMVGLAPVAAQDTSAAPRLEPGEGENEAGSALPDGLSSDLIGKFGAEELLGISPEMMAQDLGEEIPPEAALPDRYLYTTLRLVHRGGTRGCGYSDWSCMTNLCKRDLGSLAWRGWAGCHKSGGSWICYFECGLVRNTF